ncbi:sugar ABC transporter ATP-binding protein [Chromohalobacter sp. HP20-39]|uniref:sugar ABC transporter ATP-binding protein n=1 Tax=Chromohalobacter sp. HP20-39 TaxID=3079306 RepID=UPI00294B58F2|nr:sugar ABC transporter ATP-binding protein [Chromohalobacter sp. HP20-39]MDV6318136.1 sugar ABC transporter ATP-binding protein [Chromohalobacter sp. HP20-39]
MAYLHVDHVGKIFPGVTALDDIELEIEMGKVHTLAGENGAGKSTLVKILTGTERPTSGRVMIDGEDAAEHSHLYKTVAYVPQEINLFTNLTVAENLFMPFSRSHHGGMVFRRRQLEREAQAWIERFNIAAQPGDKVGKISISDQQLLQIARACTNESMKILILDEPTSSLTENEVERVFRVVRDVVEEGCGVVFISHKFDEMFAISDTISVLRNGQKIDTQPASRLDNNQLVKLMSGQEIKTDAKLQPVESDGTREVLLEVEGLSGKGFDSVSFQLRRGEILGFAGLVGSGRSEVMQTLFGFLPARAGKLRVEGQDWRLGDTSSSVRSGLFYLSEERKYHGIFPGQSVRRNIGMALFEETAGRGVIRSQKERERVGKIVRDYDIKTPTLNKNIAFLSGGNQQKAIIGRAMACNPKVLIFDEPTKGIDLRTKMEIYRLMKELAERGVGIILVSSEMDELQRCANRIITMYEGRISGNFHIDDASGADLVGAIHGHEGDGNAA